MNQEMTRLPRTIIRIGSQSLAFALPDRDIAEDRANLSGMKVQYEPYTVKSGMSMAANLRDAFRDSVILGADSNRAQVLIDAPVLLIPLEEYDEVDVEPMFRHTYPGIDHCAVMTHVLSDLNCVVAFSINKDTRMVITDHFGDVRIMPLLVPVWQHLHQRSYAGHSRKIYGFFHDGKLSVFVFAKNRFRFHNTFETSAVADSTYFILYIWQQLAMEQTKDELYLVGDMGEMDELRAELKKYVQNVFAINPSAEFNRAPVTQIPRVTYDLICLCES